MNRPPPPGRMRGLPVMLSTLAAAVALSGAALAQELGIPQGSGVQAGAAGPDGIRAVSQLILMPARTPGAANALSVLASNDGINFTSLASETWSPPVGTLDAPSLMRHTDGRYYLAYANGAGGVGIARSVDLRRWETVRDVKMDLGALTAARWLLGRDGAVQIVLTAKDGLHALTLDAAMAPQGAPARLAGLDGALQGAVLAATDTGYVAVARDGGRRLVLARSAALTGPWTIDTAAHFGAIDAGQADQQPAALVPLAGGAWRLYLSGDRNHYRDSNDGMRSWSEAKPLTGTAASTSHFGALPVDAAAVAEATRPAGTPKKVEWDAYSLKIDGKRVVVWSGEIHPFRLPNPSLWRDVIQKMKALGFNGVAFYFDWGYHSPATGVYDFSGVRNVERALQMAKEEGMYVIARTGPYVNAELTGGGYPGWMLRSRAEARTDDPVYLAAADEWMTQINAIIARHQVTDGGGTVIAYQLENELGKVEPKHVRQMAHLARKARADGINVPFFHNAAGRLPDWTPKDSSAPWANVGPTDLYAFDGYPGGTCDVHANSANANQAPDWGMYAKPGPRAGALSSPGTPGFAAELGGGWFDYWGSNGTYGCTAERQGKGYQRVFYGTNLANRITIHNIYMTFGGTSWGWLAGPVVYTSYDYGAAISEDRGLRPKAHALKQQGMFVGAAEAVLAEMDKGPSLSANTGKVKIYHNVNRRLGTHVIFAAHNPTDGKGEEAFSVKLTTSDGDYTIASRLRGQDARMLLAAYDMERQRLVYSTSELQTHLKNGERDIVLLHGRDRERGETVLRYASAPTVEVLAGKVDSRWDASKGDLVLNYVHDGLARVRISGGGRAPMLLLLADEATSLRFWTQETGAGKALQLTSALVRSASVAGGVLALRGDTHEDSAIEIWGPGFDKVTFNGAPLAFTRQNDGSARTGTVAGPDAVRLPDLGRLAWMRRTDSMEAAPDFNDSAWVEADRRPTAAQTWTMPERGQPTLAMSDYGFHHGDVWYRGRFKMTDAKANQLELFYGAGGAGMIQVWIDGRFVGQHEHDVGRSFPETTDSVKLSLGDIKPGEHVIAVMVRNNSHNWDLMADDAHREARGLISASLTSRGGQRFGVPISWRIQGRQGGETLVDRVRGPLNNGGLYGERNGWHLPEAPDKGWQPARAGAAPPAPGTYWLRTRFALDLPRGHDIQLGLAFGDTSKPRSEPENRVLIFVNGWNMGQFIAHIGPQRTFVIPPGILNPNGQNTVALAVTTDGRAENALEPVELVQLRSVRGGVPLELMEGAGQRAD
jgi:beta-galactosidase GanA